MLVLGFDLNPDKVWKGAEIGLEVPRLELLLHNCKTSALFPSPIPITTLLWVQTRDLGFNARDGLYLLTSFCLPKLSLLTRLPPWNYPNNPPNSPCFSLLPFSMMGKWNMDSEQKSRLGSGVSGIPPVSISLSKLNKYPSPTFHVLTSSVKSGKLLWCY